MPALVSFTDHTNFVRGSGHDSSSICNDCLAASASSCITRSVNGCPDSDSSRRLGPHFLTRLQRLSSSGVGSCGLYLTAHLRSSIRVL